MAWDFSTDHDFQERLTWVEDFVRQEIVPLEVLELDHATFRRIAEPLRQRVKDAGLWAAHLPPELGGQGFGQVKLALLNEIVGMTDLAPPIFGNQAPDSGNSELLAIAGTEEQKRRWMEPLLAGEIASAFAMTELGTGSDPRQLATAAVRDDDEWVITGTKWFVSNATRADIHIVMAVTDPEADPHERMSMFVVPADAPELQYRELGTMSDPEGTGPVHNHAEIVYRGVRVPADHLLGERGQAFALAQRRLGPGRIHHAMRWLGVARRAFDMLCERAVSVSVHGGPLADKQAVQTWVADLAVQMEATRLLTMKAAWKIDQAGAAAAREEIAMIKYYGAAVMHDVLDKAIQVHGSLGFSTDLPLEQMYRWSRAARIYDGPDEVHRVTVARRVLRRYEPRRVPTEHIPTRREEAKRRFADLLTTATDNH